MKKGNKIWLPVVIILAVLSVALFAGSIVVKATIGKHEAKRGSGEIVEVERDSQSTTKATDMEGNDVSYEAKIELEVIPRLQQPGMYIISSDPKYTTYTDDTFKKLSAEELYYAYYEMYARQSATFEDAKIQAFFDAKTWYYKNSRKTMATIDEDLAKSTYSWDENLKANIEAIQKYITDNNLTFTPN